jgi:hypothetical protein
MGGRPAGLVLLAWSALLALNTAVLIAFGGGTLPVLLLGGAAAAAALLAALLAARRGTGAPGPATGLSAPAALAAVAASGLVVGTELGTWLVLISAGLLVLALAALAREAGRR